MKKIIMIGIVLLLTTGCTANYNLTIDKDNNFKENIIINSENEIESGELVSYEWPTKVYYSDSDSGEYPEKLEGVEYYNENMLQSNGLYQKTLSYTLTKNKFSDSNIIKSCYEKFYYTKDNREKSVTLSTSSRFLCMDNYPSLNQVNIRVTVERPVIANNASRVSGNTYEWTITRDNYSNSSLILTYQDEDKEEIVEEQPNQEKDPVKLRDIILIIGMIAIFIILILTLVFGKAIMNR